jgi:hypothetical protein
MVLVRSLLMGAALMLFACAAVDTRVVELKPGVRFPPTSAVEVLLKKPDRQYVEIALFESRGESEADLLNDAREKARQLGADAIIKIETERVYYPPAAVYDPWYDPLFFGYYRYRPYPPYASAWDPTASLPAPWFT